MKVAFALLKGRIAPVFDLADTARVVETASGTVVRDRLEPLPERLPAGKLLHLADMGATTLVCGAMTRAMQGMAASCGMRLVGFVAGEAEEVVRAWLDGGLEKGGFAMPGCGRRLRFRADGNTRAKEFGMPMGGKGGGKGGMGGGRGQGGGGGGGQGGGGGGRGGGGGGTGQGRGMGQGGGMGQQGQCVCPKCGHTMPHQRGVPCVEAVCPECGQAMVRQ